MELSEYKACICEGAAEAARMYEKFKGSKKKPSDFCKSELKMHEVNSYEFVKD